MGLAGDARVPLSLGLALFAAGAFVSSRLTPAWQAGDFMLTEVAIGFGQGLFLVPTLFYATRDVLPLQGTTAAALFNLSRVIGQTFGTAITAISSRVSGYAVEVPVNDNFTVKAAQTLVRIDPREYRMSVQKAQAARDEAKADLAQISAQRELQQSKIAVAEAALRSAEAVVKNPVLHHPIVRFLGLLGLCAAYLQGGIDKLIDFPGAVAEAHQSGLKPTGSIAVATIFTELTGVSNDPERNPRAGAPGTKRPRLRDRQGTLPRHRRRGTRCH